MSRISATASPSSSVEVQRHDADLIVVLPAEADERVFDGVGQQFGERDGQGRGEIGRQHAEAAVHEDLDRVQGQDGVLHQQDQRTHDLVEDDLLPGLTTEDLVHDGDRAHAALGLAERDARLGFVTAARLQSQE